MLQSLASAEAANSPLTMLLFNGKLCESFIIQIKLSSWRRRKSEVSVSAAESAVKFAAPIWGHKCLNQGLDQVFWVGHHGGLHAA